MAACPGYVVRCSNRNKWANMKHKVADSETLVGDLLDLRAFCLVTDLRSVTSAAKIMGESKATVSRRIARLEQVLGVSLLKRTPRLVEPTEDGLAYRTRVGEVLELLGDANTTVRGARATPSGHLRVTSAPEFNGLLAPLVTAFGDRYPDVVVDMLVTEQVVDLGAEHVDVALRVASRLPDSQLIAHRLLELVAIAVAAPGYLRRFRAPTRLDDLEQHRIVQIGAVRMTRSLPVSRVDGTGSTVELRLRPAILASDMNFVKQAVLAGAGVAFLPTVVVEKELGERRLVHVLEAYRAAGAALYLLYQGGRFLAPKVRAFRDFVLASFSAPALPPD
jgi:DNA-binding transcriptional LysR family regulator